MPTLFRIKTYQSNFELTSKEKVDSIGVIASSAVCSLKKCSKKCKLKWWQKIISIDSNSSFGSKHDKRRNTVLQQGQYSQTLKPLPPQINNKFSVESWDTSPQSIYRQPHIKVKEKQLNNFQMHFYKFKLENKGCFMGHCTVIENNK